MQEMEWIIHEIMIACERIGEEMVARGAARIEDKEGHGNFVTDMDVFVQSRMIEELLRIVPGAQIIAEEQENAEGMGDGYCFVLDPIDGTQNFFCDMRHSAISVGICYDGELAGGVVRDPFKGETFYAARGMGAYLNGERISVSARDVRRSLALMGTSPYHEELCDRSFAVTRALMRRFADVRRTGSAALDLCYVACGRCAAYFELILQPWDFAAGTMIVREAGGIVESVDGAGLSFDRPAGILAAAPQAMGALKQAIEEAKNV